MRFEANDSDNGSYDCSVCGCFLFSLLFSHLPHINTFKLLLLRQNKNDDDPDWCSSDTSLLYRFAVIRRCNGALVLFAREHTQFTRGKVSAMVRFERINNRNAINFLEKNCVCDAKVHSIAYLDVHLISTSANKRYGALQLREKSFECA